MAPTVQRFFLPQTRHKQPAAMTVYESTLLRLIVFVLKRPIMAVFLDNWQGSGKIRVVKHSVKIDQKLSNAFQNLSTEPEGLLNIHLWFGRKHILPTIHVEECSCFRGLLHNKRNR